jgi:hypothetical protein
MKMEYVFQLRNNRLGIGLQDTVVASNLYEARDMIAARYGSPGIGSGNDSNPNEPFGVTGISSRPLPNNF